jgi:hypothetical protein
MPAKTHLFAFLLLVACLWGATGCSTPCGPNVGPFGSLLGYPVPVTPWQQKLFEDKYHWQERYARVPILGPITEGGPAVALDPPTPDEVMRSLEKARPIQGGLPLLHEVQRNNVRMVIEPIADYVDPVRVYPLIGPAQQHHAHYRCTIYYTEVTRVGWPIPHTLIDEDEREVIYIDHNHLHVVHGVNDGIAGNY